MNILEAADKYFLDTVGNKVSGLPGDFGRTFFAGAAFGALGARMSQEEILKAVREAAAPAPVAPEWSALFDAAWALEIQMRGVVLRESSALEDFRAALAKVAAL